VNDNMGTGGYGKHFMPGEHLLFEGRRYQINQYVHDQVVLIDEEGIASMHRPLYMSHRRNSE
jgi:hypothetical protein